MTAHFVDDPLDPVDLPSVAVFGFLLYLIGAHPAQIFPFSLKSSPPCNLWSAKLQVKATWQWLSFPLIKTSLIHLHRLTFTFFGRVYGWRWCMARICQGFFLGIFDEKHPGARHLSTIQENKGHTALSVWCVCCMSKKPLPHA